MTSTSTATLALHGEAYRLLLTVALLGIELGMIDTAEDLAIELVELRPDLPHAVSVRALCVFHGGNQAEALRMMERAVSEFPNHQMGKALLAACMAAAGRSGWVQLLEEVIDDGRDEHATGMACSLLGRHSEAGLDVVTPMPGNALWA